MGYAQTHSIHPDFPCGIIVTIEVFTQPGLYNFTIAGLGDTSLRESRERVGTALKFIGYTSPRYSNQKTTVLLSPSTLKKDGSHYDLALALTFLKASEQINIPNVTWDKFIFIGEIDLQGRVHPVQKPYTLGSTLKVHNSETIVMCHPDTAQIFSQFNIRCVCVNSIVECINILKSPEPEHFTHNKKESKHELHLSKDNVFEGIHIDPFISRALCIAIIGYHHILLFGPPGSGKSFISNIASQLHEPLHNDTLLYYKCIRECKKSHSHTIIDSEIVLPIRKPHHSITHTSLIGGRNPGEIAFTHKGILILNEINEFSREALEALREPLEEGEIRLTKNNISYTWKTQCTVIGTMNPCRCGNFGSPNYSCTCLRTEQQRYMSKISEPLQERFSIVCRVENIKKNIHDKNINKTLSFSQYEAQNIREFMYKRNLAQFGESIANGFIKNANYNNLYFNESARTTLEKYSQKIQSQRIKRNIMCLARTIADIDFSTTVLNKHILEAIAYTSHLPRNTN